MVSERDSCLAALVEQLATQAEQLEVLKAGNERFAHHFEFLEKQRQMAKAERFIAAERQSGLFEGLVVATPPRDPEREPASAEPLKPREASKPREPRPEAPSRAR